MGVSAGVLLIDAVLSESELGRLDVWADMRGSLGMRYGDGVWVEALGI